MKKSTRKLELGKETVRKLATDELDQVRGGTLQGCPTISSPPQNCSIGCPTEGCWRQ